MNLIKLYRAVGVEEFNSIMRISCFTCLPDGVEVKYFGLNFDETLYFANMAVNIETVAVLEATVLESVLNCIADFTHVDPFLFKSGTVEVHISRLDKFNNAIQKIVHKF